jgi:hypothetical protein
MLEASTDRGDRTSTASAAAHSPGQILFLGQLFRVRAPCRRRASRADAARIGFEDELRLLRRAL